MTSAASPLIAVARLSCSSAPIGAHCLPVLLALASRADKEGRCWPSVKCVADDARMSTRTVHAALAALREFGLVRVTARRGEEGRQGTSVYTLDVGAMMRLAEAHPRVRETQSKDPSLRQLQPGGGPDCKSSDSRLQETSVQTAPAADKQSQELTQEQTHPDAGHDRSIATDETKAPSLPQTSPPITRPIESGTAAAFELGLAYLEGLRAAGFPRIDLDARERDVLRGVTNLYSGARDALAAVAWARAWSEAWAAGTPAERRPFTVGWSAKKFSEWLATGHEGFDGRTPETVAAESAAAAETARAERKAQRLSRDAEVTMTPEVRAELAVLFAAPPRETPSFDLETVAREVADERALRERHSVNRAARAHRDARATATATAEAAAAPTMTWAEGLARTAAIYDQRDAEAERRFEAHRAEQLRRIRAIAAAEAAEAAVPTPSTRTGT
ncbi:hypothetical protein BH11MYX4_BH11MYX4_03760 [soil metagenome]